LIAGLYLELIELIRFYSIVKGALKSKIGDFDKSANFYAKQVHSFLNKIANFSLGRDPAKK